MDFYIGAHNQCSHNCPTTGNFSCQLNREVDLDGKYKVAIASVSRYYQSHEVPNALLNTALTTHSTCKLETEHLIMPDNNTMIQKAWDEYLKLYPKIAIYLSKPEEN